MALLSLVVFVALVLAGPVVFLGVVPLLLRWRGLV